MKNFSIFPKRLKNILKSYDFFFFFLKRKNKCFLILQPKNRKENFRGSVRRTFDLKRAINERLNDCFNFSFEIHY